MKGTFLGTLVVGILITTFSQTGQARCEYSYIPPHTHEELDAVRVWAIGAAFSAYSRYTNFQWDQQAYVEDVPNQALFNFGMVTATTCLDADVLQLYYGAEKHLAIIFTRAKEKEDKMKAFQDFSKTYLEIAQAYGMDRYLTPRGEML